MTTRKLIPSKLQSVFPICIWNLAGAEYAYIFMQLTQLGIDVALENRNSSVTPRNFLASPWWIGTMENRTRDCGC